MTRYTDAIARGRARHGSRFSEAGLAPAFRRWFDSGERVRVRFTNGETLTGTVGITTGWVPSFLLMRRSSDRSSSILLHQADTVVAVKRGRVYLSVEG